MRSILEFLNRDNFENRLGRIIFQLDESSLELLDDDFKQMIIEGNDWRHQSKGGNRVVWTSKDGDNLRMGDHATQRQDRPVEKGGDGGKRIGLYEIVNMFRWAWNDIMEMNYDGKLKPFEYKQKKVDAWTIECQCWLNNKNTGDKVEYCGARPRNMNLWAIWFLQENGSTVDIIIKTIFRGVRANHVTVQERIRIDSKGNVIQRYKNID